MARRYSGDIELRITLKTYKGDDGVVAPFYFAHIRAPDHKGNGILSLKECGVHMWSGDPRSPENYDKAALAFIKLASHWVSQHASRQGDEITILRVQQAPCPTKYQKPCPCGRPARRRK